MGIQLDWEIEQSRGGERHYEDDPHERGRGWRSGLRFVLVLGLFLLLLGGAIFLVSQRLEQVDARTEQLLRDTVGAEVASLRIGDRATFQTLQRSATRDWLDAQTAFYDQVQQAKTDGLSLTGRIVDLTIDGQRARVRVEEIQGGVPYVRTWFYWRYNATADDPGGWFHVPPDYTFWGEDALAQRERLTVRYKTMDETFALALADQTQAWLDFACQVVDCAPVGHLTLDVVASTLPYSLWTEGDAWQLVIASPYVGRARLDQPFDSALQLDVATRLAERLTISQGAGLAQPQPYADSAYLRQALIAWLVGRFVQQDTGVRLIDSLYSTYGAQAVGRLAHNVQPADSIEVLARTLGLPDLGQAALDWRDFLAWRLNTEAQLLAERNEAAWASFYAMIDPGVASIAYQRYNANAPRQEYRVASVILQRSPGGLPQLVATVEVGSGSLWRQELIAFNLVDGRWLRAS